MALINIKGDTYINTDYIVLITPVEHNQTSNVYYYKILIDHQFEEVYIPFSTKDEAITDKHRLINLMAGEK
jgi:hypothetical protein